jgi:hypothetical protein
MSDDFLARLYKKLKAQNLDTLAKIEENIDTIPESILNEIDPIDPPNLTPKEQEALLIWLNRKDIPQA